jgi:hypothetical protein
MWRVTIIAHLSKPAHSGRLDHAEQWAMHVVARMPMAIAVNVREASPKCLIDLLGGRRVPGRARTRARHSGGPHARGGGESEGKSFQHSRLRRNVRLSNPL